jgi:hypothetical protein
MSNMEAARDAEKDFGAEIVVIKKTSPEYDVLQDKSACPSVAVNGRLIAKNDIVTFEQLKTTLQS